MPKGKTPSLIGSSLGRPAAVTAKRSSPCSRCDADIALGEMCYDVPQPAKKFRRTRRFCASCFATVLERTKQDLAELEGLLQA